MSISLRLFRFLEFDLGEKPPRITAVRFHRRTENKQIVLDLDISFDGPIEVEVALFKRFLKLGANHIEVRGGTIYALPCMFPFLTYISVMSLSFLLVT
eukprot:XP_012808114.1 PREDICTED: extended synaptotagmin-1-like [Xenopus tropicalis]